MDLILNSADNLGHAVDAFDDPTEVSIKTWLPCGLVLHPSRGAVMTNDVSVVSADSDHRLLSL
jgi:hypothetical protein